MKHRMERCTEAGDKDQRETFQPSTRRRSSVRKRHIDQRSIPKTRQRCQPSETSDHAVVNYGDMEREHLPRTDDHEVAQHRVVVLEVPDANLGAVNYHKVTLQEHAACKKRRITKSRASQTENRQTTTASSASGDQKKKEATPDCRTPKSRSTRRVGEREIEGDDALAEQRSSSIRGEMMKRIANSRQRRIKRAYRTAGEVKSMNNSRGNQRA